MAKRIRRNNGKRKGYDGKASIEDFAAVAQDTIDDLLVDARGKLVVGIECDSMGRHTFRFFGKRPSRGFAEECAALDISEAKLAAMVMKDSPLDLKIVHPEVDAEGNDPEADSSVKLPPE